MPDGPPDPLTAAERAVLNGSEDDPPPGSDEASRQRRMGLRALAEGRELDAVAAFRRAREASPPGSLQWAVNERLHGLALIRALREVEGTFALERSDPILDSLGVERFTLDESDD